MMMLYAIAGITMLLVPGAVAADYTILNDAVNSVGMNLPNLAIFSGTLCDALDGPCGVAAIASHIITTLRPMLTIVGVLALIIAGIRMIIAQDDEVLGRTRKVMIGTISGIVLAYLIEPFFQAFYGRSGSIARGEMATGAAILTDEVQGLINWALTIAAVLAILIIIITALKAMSYGQLTSAEGITSLRKTILSVIGGLILLAIRAALSTALGSETPDAPSLLLIGVQMIGYVLSFFCLAAVCVLVYAGIQLVVSFGNSEALSRAKSILFRAVIGCIVFFLSLALIRFVIEPGIG